MQMKNKLVEEKASMAIYVFIVLFSFLIILSSLYFSITSIRKGQLITIMKIKQSYEKDNQNIEEIYQSKWAEINDTIAPTATITVSSTVALTGKSINATVLQEDSKLNFSKCRYVYNTVEASIGTDESNYTGGELTSDTNNLELRTDTVGRYYLHVLTVDKKNNMTETISSPIDVLSGDSLLYSTPNTISNPYYTFVAPADGVYNLEVWGAEGGTYDSSYATGGKGGYSKGEITLKKGVELYVYVGGKGEYSTSLTHSIPLGGGYNGGGAAGYRGGTGGGATDIRISSGNWNDNTSLLSRIIVAGGGGGAYADSKNYKANGGEGGGTSGLSGGHSGIYSAWAGGGASQTSGGTGGKGSSSNYNGEAGSFGKGGSTGDKYDSTSYYSNGAGGGGWYGGGAAGNYSLAGKLRASGGGGGSGFVFTLDTANNVPTGYVPTDIYYLNNTIILDGTKEFSNSSGTGTEVGHSGDGYAKITPISVTSSPSTTTSKKL